MPVKLLVVGGGRIGGALISGLLASDWATPGDIAVVEPVAEARAKLSAQHPGLVVWARPEPDSVSPDGGAVLAVKPDIAESVCAAIAPARPPRLLSVVAGLSTERLEAALPPETVVVRAMPNTPVLVRAGVSAISGGSRAHAEDLDWAEDILSAVGTVVRLPERLLDVVTGLSGSGPAYLFLLAEALIEAGVLGGLTREVSRELVTGTMLGSSRLLAETGASPEALRADITSPGGTTAAGLRALEARAVRSAFLEAVAAATERSRQLGR
ncbi:MAG TPA: pyrroline-5-carboxylate reductase [Acidimicrobiales bacterium]|nr:pyrroline-5-carboxylate reductase [Acidimicrobiales bacterium]